MIIIKLTLTYTKIRVTFELILKKETTIITKKTVEYVLCLYSVMV
jgi:hypothetical protein